MNQHANRWSRLRVFILAPLVLFLIWEVITRSLAAYLSAVSPEMAIRLSSSNPTALLSLAEDRLKLDPAFKNLEPLLAPPGYQTTDVKKGIQPSPDLDFASKPEPSIAQDGSPRSADMNSQTTAQIRSWAKQALLNDPLNARAFRILGQVAQRDSAERAKPLMQAAVRRSLLEGMAVYWMMRTSYEDQDYRAAFGFANTLFRTHPQTPELVMPTLGRLAENPRASGELKELLAGNPSWRAKFFEYLPANISDARTPLDIFLSLKDTSSPPTVADLGHYLKFLVRRGFYDLAYYSWLQFLPAEQLSKAGHLFNGNFEIAPSELPFDWVFTQGSGVTIEIAPRSDADGEHALFIEFGHGRVEDFGVTQLVMLAPGSYQFRGKHKVDIVSQRGVRWRIKCAREPKTVIGESRTSVGAGSTWEDFEFSFTVPETDCPAQYVQLALDAHSASEQFVSGTISYDDLQIMRELAAMP